MKRTITALLLTVALTAVCPEYQFCYAAGETSGSVIQAGKAWRDPARYDKAIAKYEAETTAPMGGIVAYGSSSMGGWHKTLSEDLEPFPIVRRGFGGSNMNDAVHFMDRIVIPLKPRAVLLYEGDNDVSDRHSTELIIGKYREFISRLRTALPETRTYIISVKPSISRWRLWPAMQEVNEELKKIAASDPLVFYIDVATPMLDAEGKPRKDIFKSDKLHMNEKGYEIWKNAVRPVLLENEPKTPAVR